MDDEVLAKLDGSEFITTFFNPMESTIMFVAIGDNLDGKQRGMKFVYIYICINGEIDRGIETFMFSRRESVEEFIDQLPEMSAFEFLAQGIGVQPKIYDR